MALRSKAIAGSLAKTACAGLGAILLAACATGQKGHVLDGDADYKDAVGVFANPEADPSGLDPIASAAYWGTQYNRQPNNPETAVQYSNALRKIGSLSEAVTVMTKAVQKHPDHAGVNLETGKALVEDGRAFEAVRYIETALLEKSNDWRALSAYGVALDQIGEHKQARFKYDAALQLAPDAVSVMSNKGLSYALSGDLESAEAVLRAAASNRRSDARIRQNLALVLAIKGDMREATRLARSDLPPQTADNNIDYFRALTAQPAYWQEYAADAVDVPDFDAAPSAPAASEPAPLKQPEEEPKQQKKDKNAPVALAPATGVTNASAVAEEKQQEEEAEREIENAPELKSQ